MPSLPQADPDKAKAKKPRPGRKRRTLGWTLLILGLLVAAVWVASGWCGIGYGSADTWSSFHRGTVTVTQIEKRNTFIYPLGLSGQSSGTLIPQWEWTGEGGDISSPLLVERRTIGVAWYYRQLGLCRVYGVVLWPIPLLLWIPAALLLRSGILARRRAVKGQCAKCGYSLAGLADGAACPECGKGARAAA